VADLEDATDLQAQILVGKVIRASAVRDLTELGINPSLADVEAWVAATPKQRVSLAKAYAIYMASYGEAA
jgi:hypothetical protein